MAMILFINFAALSAEARVVTVEEGSGAGLLVNQGGNCYVILPTHVHGLQGGDVRLGSERASGPIGTAKIVYIVPGNVDISLGLVRGGMAQDCGFRWGDLPRRLDEELLPGTPVILRRARQRVMEGRRLIIKSSGFREFSLAPQSGERADLFGGTSGAVVFLDNTPIGIVLKASDRTEALALRIDEVVAQLSRFLDGYRGAPAPATTTMMTGEDDKGDPIEAVSWTAHPVEGASDPASMLAGNGPWIFELNDKPVDLELRLSETDRISSIRLFSKDTADAAVPRKITIKSQATSDPNRPRSTDLPAPEMTPDGEFDLRFGEIFSKHVTVTIHSSWGGGSPVRLDGVIID